MAYVPRLKTKYNEEIVSALKEKFQYKSVNLRKIFLTLNYVKECQLVFV